MLAIQDCRLINSSPAVSEASQRKNNMHKRPIQGEISPQYFTWCNSSLHPKTLIAGMVENYSSVETKHFSTRSTRFGFSNAAATLSLSFSCLLTAAPQSKFRMRMVYDSTDKKITRIHALHFQINMLC